MTDQNNQDNTAPKSTPPDSSTPNIGTVLQTMSEQDRPFYDNTPTYTWLKYFSLLFYGLGFLCLFIGGIFFISLLTHDPISYDSFMRVLTWIGYALGHLLIAVVLNAFRDMAINLWHIRCNTENKSVSQS